MLLLANEVINNIVSSLAADAEGIPIWDHLLVIYSESVLQSRISLHHWQPAMCKDSQ